MIAADGVWELGAWHWDIGFETVFWEHRNRRCFISDPVTHLHR